MRLRRSIGAAPHYIPNREQRDQRETEEYAIGARCRWVVKYLLVEIVTTKISPIEIPSTKVALPVENRFFVPAWVLVASQSGFTQF